MKNLRRLCILIVLIPYLLTSSRGLAQEDVLPLFGSVQPARVTVASAVVGTEYNQREYSGAEAQDFAQLVKGYGGRFTSSDSIQPYTWNFQTWQPREYTPLVFKVSVLEEWDTWEERQGELRLIENKHYNTVDCYEVGYFEVYDCRQYQGSIYYSMTYHVNSIQMKKTDVEQLIIELGM